MSPFYFTSAWESKLWVAFAFCGLLFATTACDDTTIAPENGRQSAESPTPGEVLPPDVELRIQYDQTEVTYSSVWPGSIVGNNAKRKNAPDTQEGAKLMTEFERTHDVRSYDDEGYLSASYSYIEGHPDMNMPEDAYQDLRSEMPYDPKDENPIVRSELRRDEIRYIRADGSEARTRPIDPELYRIDPATLDSLEDVQDDSSVANGRRSEVLESLQQRGISFRRLDANRVAFDQRLEDVRGASTVKKVIDLRIGQPIYLKYELKNGNTDMVETRRYNTVSGLPLMVQSVTYNYDDRTGSWGVVTRTEVTRKNISVQFD